MCAGGTPCCPVAASASRRDHHRAGTSLARGTDRDRGRGAPTGTTSSNSAAEPGWPTPPTCSTSPARSNGEWRGPHPVRAVGPDRPTALGQHLSMPSPAEQLADLRRRISQAGHTFPTWIVPSTTGHHGALISEAAADPHSPWRVAQVVRADTLTSFVDAGLIRVGEPAPLPEYQGRRGFRWSPGSAGCRITTPSST